MSEPARKVRILFLCHDATPYGAQRSLQLIVENLPREKYQVFVSFERDGELATYFKTLPYVTVLYSKRIHAIRHHHRHGLARLLDFMVLLLSLGRGTQLAKLCKKHQINLIHSNTLVSLSGGVAARLAGLPHVWHIREWFNQHNERMQLIPGKVLTKWLVSRLSDRVLCVSTLVHKQFAPYSTQNPDKYPVLPNAIDYEALTKNRQSLSTENERLGLVYLGRISDGKRFQDIIDALCILKTGWSKEHLFPFELKAYGNFISDDFKRQAQQTIEEHGLTSHVHFPGYSDNLAECFSGVNLLLNPSTNESFGRTVIEAMAFGIPVLAARSGGPTEVIREGETGLFFEPERPDDLARQLKACQDKPEWLQAMGKAAQGHVRQHYDIQAQISRLDALYQDLTRGS